MRAKLSNIIGFGITFLIVGLTLKLLFIAAIVCVVLEVCKAYGITFN